MPRQARESSGTGIYHVMMRGINHQNIFEEPEDYYQFIATLDCMRVHYDEEGKPYGICCILVGCAEERWSHRNHRKHRKGFPNTN